MAGVNDRTLDGIYLVLVLLLVVSSLSLRRFSPGLLVRSVLGWLAIGLLIWIGVAHRYQLAKGWSAVTAMLGLDDQQVAGDTVRIRQSPDGHFWAQVQLNGVERRLLIDTGATVTALSADTAKAVGARVDETALPVEVETANGSAMAKPGTIADLRIGPLHARNLGVLVSPDLGSSDLLGMNFLSQLGSWRVEDHVLILEPGKTGRSGKN